MSLANSVNNLITQHLDTWTQAIETKSTAGRGSSNKLNLVGIQKLRELILEMAVMGKLVSQNPNDEPASVLLEKIAAEKAQLIKEGKIKKQQALPEITEDEKPFDLPNGWEWIRLIDAGYNLGQKTPSSEFSYIDVGSINKELGVIEAPTILNADEAPSRARKIVTEGTVIYSTVRPYLLNIAVVDKLFIPEPIASTAFAIVHPFKGLLSSYIYRYLRSNTFIQYVESCQTGVAYPAINDKQFFNGVIPVAPLEEQKRIVAKVDELMALCDQLESETLNQIDTHQTLVSTLLGNLVNPENTANFEQAWSLIAENFDVLFTTEDSIDQLKQTILQLAVMGKLVPQNPNDEPASKLLEKIAAEKAQLIKDGKIKKSNPLPEITEDEKPFDLPKGWELVRFGDVTFNRDANRIPLSVDERKHRQGEYDYYGASGVIDKIDAFLFDKPLLLIGEDGANLVNRSTPIAFIARGKYWVNNHAHVIDGISEQFLLFLELYINSISLLPYITGTAQPKMNQAKMNSIPVVLPPKEEQTRIVSKVNELMTLCDQLKTQLQTAQTTQCHLAQSITQEILQ